MASITRNNNKNKPSYKIRVSCGYAQKKKIVKTFTYRPDPTLTEKQQAKAAQQYADELERKIEDGVSFDGKKTTFEQFATDWLARKQSLVRFNTYKGYEMMIRTKLLPAFGTMKMANIKLPHIENFLVTMTEDASQSYIIHSKTLLNKIFKDAVRYNMIERNPCENVELPKAKKKKDERKFLTPDQVQIFLNSLNMELKFAMPERERTDSKGTRYTVSDYTERRTTSTQLKVLFNIAVFCGMRRGELLALQWRDIDFEEKTISISKAAAKTANGVKCNEPKTKSSVRMLPLPEPIIPLLRQYRREYDEYRCSLGDKWQGQGNLFIQADGKLMGLSTPYHYLKRHIMIYNAWVERQNEQLSDAQEKMELLPDVTLHGLRHSCATWLNHIDVNILVISKILGHAQVSTTMNIYAHGFQSQLHEASAKMSEDWSIRTGQSEQRAVV